MAVTLEQVKAALDPEEPAYNKAAAALGPEALPHLARLVAGDHTMLAAKAAYLAGLIGSEKAVDVVQRAARSSHASVRVAAAAAAGKLADSDAGDVLINLIDDGDAGVQKVALRSVPTGAVSDALRARVMSLGMAKGKAPNRELSQATMARISGSTADTSAKAAKKSAAKKSTASKSRKRK
jgi:HEAT repeat protein